MLQRRAAIKLLFVIFAFAPDQMSTYIGSLWEGILCIKIAIECRNVGDAAYAMSHAAAEACTQRLAAGRGHGYRLAASSLQPDRGTCSGPAC